MKSLFIGLSVAFFVSACGGSTTIVDPDIVDPDGTTIVDPIDLMPTTSILPDEDDPEAVSPIDLTNNTSCDVAVQNQWAYNNMQDYYLFYDQVPNVDPRSFNSTAELVREVRFQERDPFSSVSNAAVSTLQFQEGREFGLGFIWGLDVDGVTARLVIVEPNSPFGLAGLERGDIILNVNGAAFDGLTDEIEGTPDAPGTSVWDFQRRDSGEQFSVEITSAEYDITTVLETETFTSPLYNGTIGYFLFNRFLRTSIDDLRETFQTFSARNVTDLVVDLRYNTGGSVEVAQFLSSLLAGNSRSGELLQSYQYNDKYTSDNFEILTFETSEADLGLSRIVFLTRNRTASASEIVISGLSPHMEVITMGQTTAGKSYIQRPNIRCGEALNAIHAEGFNDAGVSVFGGIAPSCLAFDDWTSNFGANPNTGEIEGMLLSALDFLVLGACDVPTLVAGRSALLKQPQLDENHRQGIVDIGGAFH